MLSTYDYLVIGFYFAFMALIGLVCRKFIKTTSDYFRGGGQMLWWMTGCSAFVVQFSAWTFTGGAGKAYQDGPVILVIYFSNALAFFFTYLFFGSRFRQMRVITAVQGIKERFGNASEQFFTWVQIPMGVLNAGIWLSGISVFISAAFNVPLHGTVIITGTVVLIISVLGGSWAVAAGDFIQTLVLMPITLVTAVLALSQVGGWGSFIHRMPHHFLHWTEESRSQILYLWILAFVIKQFISINNVVEGSRYLTVKDSRQARKAALLGTLLFIIGPVVWFIPPMVVRIMHPDMHALFPNLENPSEGAYVAAGLDDMPAGMLGLLISGIFGATMSTMDVGLNKNAGFFVKNFYHPVVRPNATDSEQLMVGKLATLVLGTLVIPVAIIFSTTKIGLFNLMVQFGALIALPYCIPLVLGSVIKRAPGWAGWTTVLVGFATSVAGKNCFTAEWLDNFMHWNSHPLTQGERDDWTFLIGVLLNVIVCSAWFLGTCLYSQTRSEAEKKRVDEFFQKMHKPVDFKKEIGAGNDAQQYRTLGILCLIYGAFMTLLVLIPNSPGGRLGMFVCAATMLGFGGGLYWNSLRLKSKSPVSKPSINN